jgi:hypothetical protein
MKIKSFIVLCVCAASLCNVNTTYASEDKSLDAVADVAIVRPGCLIATVAGSAVFVAVLPIAVISRSVKKTANTLVIHPAKATFTRPIGDFSDLE